MMRPIAAAVVVVALSASGCMNAGFDEANRVPQNDGANANVEGGLSLRNVFLLGGTDSASPPPQQALFGVIVNDGQQAHQLERVTMDGGGTVQLAGQPLTLPPDQAVGTGNKPIGTATGVRGSTVPMTFTFRDAKPVRLMVPVMTRTGHFSNLPSAPAGSPTPAAPVTSPPPPQVTNQGTASPGPTATTTG
ncbi:unnamed protein product [[Actinomadura] parvosata subsp. kistnae]|nr:MULTISPECIES: hypothetical protein [unclassified Nonomuraea]NJP98534.1 hypothetical protein [Nonomuraea sp. FMUSA5-5]SPL96615.1 unnamed protein product [Actinomadura parvosata subsp. kistnae]